MAVSERVIDVLEVKGSLGIAEASKGSILCDIKGEAVALHAVELLHGLTSFVVEALRADLLVAAARQH